MNKSQAEKKVYAFHTVFRVDVNDVKPRKVADQTASIVAIHAQWVTKDLITKEAGVFHADNEHLDQNWLMLKLF